MRIKPLSNIHIKIHKDVNAQNKSLNNIYGQNGTSFGYLLSAKQANWLKYLCEKAPSHIKFYDNMISHHPAQTSAGSMMRDLYTTIAINEARLLKGFETIKTFFKKNFK